MRLEYVLFDLDDTLYPRDAIMPSIDERIEIFLGEILSLEPAEASAKRHHYNKIYGSVIRGLLQEEVVDINTYFDYVHNVPVAQLIDPNPELAEALLAIPLRKYIFTNSYRQHAENVLAALRIEHCFEGIFDVRSVNFVSKPARQSYASVVQALGTVPEACIFVDDKAKNMKAPGQMGMKTVLVDAAPDEWVDIAADDIVAACLAIEELVGAKGNLEKLEKGET